MLYVMNIAKIIFPLITLPYLTRVLSVPAYGVVGYVKAAMAYMQLTVDFGFMLSGTRDIVMAGDDKDEIDHQVGNIFCARILLGIIAFAILMCCVPFISMLRENLLFTVLSFIVVFLTCFLMDFYFRGIEKMEVIAIRFVVMKGIATALTFVMVKGDEDILWIPVLDIIGSLVALVLVWNELRKLGVRIRPQGFNAIFTKIRDSAVYFFSDMATTAFNALNTLLIGIFIDPTGVAYWSVCMQLVSAVQSLYNPITNGIYPHMMRSKQWSLLKKTALMIMPVVIAGCVFTFFIAKYALLIIAGAKYVPAAPTLRLLIPVMFFSFPAMLFGWPALGAIGKQNQTTLTTIFSALFQITVLVILILTGRIDLVNICIARCITEALLFFSRYTLCRKYRKEFAD